MGIEIDLMTDGAPAQSSDNLAASRSGSPVRLTPDDIGDRVLANAAYHFAGFAGDQIAGDGKFFDRSGMGNHGVRGADLSDANMFANAGYVSTVNPTGGATDSVIRMPNLNFDYAGGEKLLLWWLGLATPEGSDARILGDGRTATSRPGISIRAKSTGKIDAWMYGAGGTSGATGISTSTVFDSTLHSFAFWFDGENKQYGVWVDEAVDIAIGSFDVGTVHDTTNANTFNIGTSDPVTGVTHDGIACQTRAFHMLRLSSTDTALTQGEITNLLAQLRANPGAAVLGRAF